MPQSQTTTAAAEPQVPFRWPPITTAEVCGAFADPLDRPTSQRHYARKHGIPRSTLGYWLRKPFPDHLDPAVVTFFRSPAGLAFLRRLVLALLLIFRHTSPVGLRAIGQFLDCTDLGYFVGSSVGALHAWDGCLQDQLIRFAQEQRQALADGMPVRDIGVCLDEHFHAGPPCLIGIEPVSNFILVEGYQPQRDSVTWAAALRAGIEGLPVRVVAITSDRGSALIRCAEEEFRVLHWPELFHLTHDLTGPVGSSLSAAVRDAQQQWDDAHDAVERLSAAEAKRPDSIDATTWFETVRVEVKAGLRLEKSREQREEALEAIRDLGRQYHPFDRQSAEPVTAEQVQARLTAAVDRLATVVSQAELAESAVQAVQQARDQVVVLAGCQGWFWSQVERRLDELELAESAEQVVRERLLGSYYWERASQRESDSQQRDRLTRLAERAAAQAWAAGGELSRLPADQRQQVEQVCREVVGLFCRSSSCVEGRNGRLSLFQHGQTRLSPRRLEALTAVHNYVAQRGDGTTAAERFFGQKPSDPFTWLLERMPDLPGPAAKRPRKPVKVPSTAA
jgi:hypothetical protein